MRRGEAAMGQISNSMTITNAFTNMQNAMVNTSTSVGNSSSVNAFSQSLSNAKETTSSSKISSTQKERITSSQNTKQTLKSDTKSANDEVTAKENNGATEQKDVVASKKDSKATEKNADASKNKKTEESQQVQQTDTAGTEEDEAVVIDEQILAIVSQALQIPIEDIKMQLDDLGLQVQDLLTEDGFSQFVNQMFGEGSMENLLSSDVDIKSITQLFNDLKNFKETFNVVNQQEVITIQEGVLEQVQAPVEEEQVILPQPQSQSAEEVVVTELATTQGEENHNLIDEMEEATSVVGVTTEGEVDSEGLGITVPIHNFTTTSFTQSFETEAGVMTQTTTTKQAVNGKAFIEQVDFKMIAQTKEINVSLSPKELGNLNIKIVENNGAMVAEIKVDNNKAKEFILSEIQELKDSLSEQGLNVTDVKVDIRQDNHQSQMEQERQKSSKRIQEIISKHLGEDTEELEEKTPIPSNSEVDYMV